MANQTPLLDLKTLTERHTVRVDGKAYTLKPMSRFSVLETLAFPEQTARLSALATLKKLTPEQNDEIERLLDEICRVILDAPDAVHERLTGPQRMQVCNVFTLLRQGASPTRRRTTGANQTTSQAKTGATFSRGSRGSTAATR